MQESLSIPQPLFYLKDRSIISIEGVGGDEFLQGLMTQDIYKLQSSQAIYGFFLNQLGRYVMDVFLFQEKDIFYLDVPTPMAKSFVQKLNIYKLRRPLVIALGDHLRVLASSKLDDLLQFQLNAFKAPFSDPRCQCIGFRCVVSKDLENLNPEDPEAVDSWAYDQALINLGIPRHGFELISDRTIPLEANLEFLNGVSFEKGCYVGQELTSRTHHLGQIRKRYLPFVWLDSTNNSKEVNIGEDITFKGEKVGIVTSVTAKGGMGRILLESIEKSSLEKIPLLAGGAPLKFINPAHGFKIDSSL